mgnify:FL=1
MDTEGPLKIKLRIGDNIFPITIEREKEKFYRDAEHMINALYAHYAKHYVNQSPTIYLMMVALDLAVNLQQTTQQYKDRNDITPFKDSINTLRREIETRL